MGYCDYTFYTNTYLGNVIAVADFPRLAERASEKIDVLTFNRIDSDTSDEVMLKVKKAVCRIAEIMNDIDISYKASRENYGMGIASVKAGSESISYNNNSLVGAVLNNPISQDKLFYDCASDYLNETGLLYAGL